ncbi:THAP domain-containing protein 3 isoform X1 [Malaclemys terrapin pileata]|uniref:THAP domain-containing protein 3 isoform X1 n=1 Tax=Malaclemys terrapin pileata TaxID=2991368 RepID=UPI0023A7BF9A|nr:THAP domain-containing protein 3 isoform X1 [Malaclemys terrapin pileata]
MPKSCAALRCSNRYSSRCRQQLTFHRFPFSRPELLARWVGNIGRGDFQPSSHTVLCSQHFQPDCFSAFGNRTNLKPNAVPTLFACPRTARDFTRTEDGRRLDEETVLHQEPQPSRTEEPREEVSTTKAPEVEGRLLQSRPPVQRHHPVQTSDHNYAVSDCASLKQKLFQALEENEKLQKRLKVKSMALRRMFVRLQACKKEQQKHQARQPGGREQGLTF